MKPNFHPAKCDECGQQLEPMQGWSWQCCPPHCTLNLPKTHTDKPGWHISCVDRKACNARLAAHKSYYDNEEEVDLGFG